MIYGSIHQKQILTIYVNNNVWKQMKENLTELRRTRKYNNQSWDLACLPSVIDKIREKMNKDIETLNNSINQKDPNWHLKNTLHVATAKYTFSNIHRIIFRIDYMLSHKASLKKIKRTEIIQSTFYHNRFIKLEILCRKVIENPPIFGK